MAMDGPTEEKNATDGIDTCQRDIYDDGSNADHRSINNQDCEPENNHHYGEIEESEGDSSSVGADQASSHMHAESGVLIPSWKVIHHQIEKKIARYFGSAKVNEARRKVQLLASQRQPGTAAVAHGRSVVAAGHAVSHLETALWESQTMVVGGQIPADGSVSGRADMMHACSHLTEKPDNKEMMVNQPSFSLPRHLSCSSGSAYKKERDPMFSNRSGGSLLLADGLDEADKADGLDGSDGSDTVASTDANHLNIILPHGCQLMRTIYHPNASFKMILYMPIGETDRFASLDTNHVHLWRDSRCRLKVPVFNIYPKPAVSLEFVNKYDEIVVGSVGAVMIWQFEQSQQSAGKMVCCRTPRLVISDLQIDEWVTFSAFDDARDYLYTVYENNFNTVDDRFTSQLENHPRDDDHTHEITGIACLETPLYCVFATSSQDGTVKVWDAVHNILIREMQFSDTTKSICFANPRGDLLVGISDQIALVQVHDYLPEKYLLMLSESHWPDDLIEAPMELDSGVDFWKPHTYHTNSESRMLLDENLESNNALSEEDALTRLRRNYKPSKNGPDFGYLNDSTGTMNRYRLISKEQAHSYIPFDEMPYKAQRRRFFDDDGQEVVKYDIPEMEFDVLMKDNERISERIRPHSTNILEPIGGPRPGSSYSTVFKYDKKSLGIAALDIAQRAINGANQSEFRLLPQKEAVPTFDLGKPRALEVSRGRVLDVLERARTRKMKQDDQDRKRLEALMGDAKPAPNQKMARRKGWILDSMIKSGVAPNSVISGDVDRMQHLVREQQRRDQEKQFQISEAEALKKAPRIDVLDTNYCSKDTSLLGAEHRKSTLNKESSSCRSSTSSIEARPTWGTGIPILETRKGRKKSIAKYELQAIENDSDDYDPSKYKKRTSRAPSVVHQRKSLRTPPTDEEDRSVIKLLVEEKALPLLTEEDEIGRVSASLSSQSIEDRVDDPDPSRAIEMTTTGTESDGNPVAQSSLDYALKDDLLVTDKGCIIDAGNSHHSLLASKTSSLDEFSNSKIVGDDFKTSIIPGLATPPDPDTYELHNNSRDNIGNDLDSKTMKPFTPIEFPCGIEVAEEIETASTLEKSSSRDYDFEPVLHTFLSDKITSKLAWDLFKSVVVHPNEDNAQGRVFSQFKSTDWFHGIENAETNVTNIVASLCETLRSGALKDKIQAAKGMMYMYYTFKDDMSDPLEQIINPQLEQIHDSNWQVRAQLICNLTSFEKFDENIILEMIMALADPHPKVVQAAINGLISFGISSTEALRCAMIQFHMIIPTKEEHAMPVILLNNMESQLQGIHSPELVKDYSHIVQWLTHVDKRVYGHPFIRPDSSVVTMCEHSRRILPRKGRYEEPCNTRLIPANTRSGSESTTDKLNSPLQAKLAYSHSQSHTLARTNQHQTTRTYFPTIGRLGAQMHSSTSK
ncbi:hypothetical protein BASA81_016884 [Batrachochytrium salamandrivorans]|nr:hypothetical protein BASA81_016884 [Batrachochytrium salamandrivorans]